MAQIEKIEVLIIGAGVVGLAIARALAQLGREVLILEEESAIASVTSSRNSGVIHAGFYYRPKSLKARACVRGRILLYEYASLKGIPHKRCGKIVVATETSQVAQLKELETTALDNNVTGLRLLTATEVSALEPEIKSVAALLSPDTGILDVHSYALALLGDAENSHATLALQTPVIGGEINATGIVVEVGGISPTKLECRLLINAAGLGAQKVARSIKGLDPRTIPPQVLAKGSYFSLTGRQPFQRLIYPVPVMGSLGLHACCDLSGRVRFGPDIEWINEIDYRVNPARVSEFEGAVRRYWPGLPDGALIPDYAGVRPKIAHASHYDTDFVLQTKTDHKISGLVNFYGIESPGLTSSMALAEELVDRIQKNEI